MNAINYTLTERARYAPATLTNELPELMEELDHFRELGCTPGDLEDELNSLREIEEKPADYESLQEFFNDMVSTNEEYAGCWPGAEPHQMNPVIREVIEQRYEYHDALFAIRNALKVGDIDLALELIPTLDNKFKD